VQFDRDGRRLGGAVTLATVINAMVAESDLVVDHGIVG
jgi:hypothetical protein